MVFNSYFRKSFCGCSLRAGTLFIGWLYFILCIIPSVIFFTSAIVGTIEVHKYMDLDYQDNWSHKSSENRIKCYADNYHYPCDQTEKNGDKSTEFDRETSDLEDSYHFEDDGSPRLLRHRRDDDDDNNKDEFAGVNDEEDDAVYYSNDDPSTFTSLDTEHKSALEYIIHGVVSAFHGGSILYEGVLGLIFGLGANFHLLLLIGAHCDVGKPIAIWLAGRAIFLFVDLGLLGASVFYTGVFLMIAQILRFGFNLYSFLVVRSHLHFLKHNVKLLKSTDAVELGI